MNRLFGRDKEHSGSRKNKMLILHGQYGKVRVKEYHYSRKEGGKMVKNKWYEWYDKQPIGEDHWFRKKEVKHIKWVTK